MVKRFNLQVDHRHFEFVNGKTQDDRSDFGSSCLRKNELRRDANNHGRASQFPSTLSISRFAAIDPIS